MITIIWKGRYIKVKSIDTVKCVRIIMLIKSSYIHCAKNHISQVLEYHEKFKNTKKTSTFHQLFRSKKYRISYLWKVQNKNFSIFKKHGEENMILHQLFEAKEDRISHLRKVQNKNFPTTWTFPFVQSSCFCNNLFCSFIETCFF